MNNYVIYRLRHISHTLDTS